MDTSNASSIYQKLMRERRTKLQAQIKRCENRIDIALQELEELSKILEPDDTNPTKRRPVSPSTVTPSK